MNLASNLFKNPLLPPLLSNCLYFYKYYTVWNWKRIRTLLILPVNSPDTSLLPQKPYRLQFTLLISSSVIFCIHQMLDSLSNNVTADFLPHLCSLSLSDPRHCSIFLLFSTLLPFFDLCPVHLFSFCRGSISKWTNVNIVNLKMFVWGAVGEFCMCSLQFCLVRSAAL